MFVANIVVEIGWHYFIFDWFNIIKKSLKIFQETF